jgi:hypothetical protein
MSAMTWKAPEITRPGGSLTAGEPEMLRGLLAWHRATFLYKCAGLTGEQLAECSVPPSGVSLLGLIRHLTDVERTWFRQQFAGEAIDGVHYTGRRDGSDFAKADQARAAEDYELLVQEWRLADAAVAGSALDDTFTDTDGDTYSLRFVYLHMIGEYARHNGHADLIRERVDGATGA